MVTEFLSKVPSSKNFPCIHHLHTTKKKCEKPWNYYQVLSEIQHLKTALTEIPHCNATSDFKHLFGRSQNSLEFYSYLHQRTGTERSNRKTHSSAGQVDRLCFFNLCVIPLELRSLQLFQRLLPFAF